MTVTRMGEQDLGELGHLALLVGHRDAPLLAGGQQPDHRRLNDGHQGHVAVGCHHNGTQVLGPQGVGHKDGGGAVGGSDDGNGGSVLQVKEEPGQKQGKKDAELCGCAKKHQPGLFQQGAKVDHGTNADKQQQGKSSLDIPASNRAEMGPTVSPLGNGSESRAG